MPAQAEQTKTLNVETTYMVPYSNRRVSMEGMKSDYLLLTVEALLVVGELAERVHGVSLGS